MAAAANKKRREGERISVNGGAGILMFGGALITAALGAAFLVGRSRANKRKSLPAAAPPSNEVQEKKIIDDERIFEDCGAKMELQSLIPPIHQEGVPDLAVERSFSIDHISASENTVTIVETQYQNNQILEEFQTASYREAEEVEERHGVEQESLSMESEQEVTETSIVEEEGSDGAVSSSVESSTEAVWPVELIHREEESSSTEMREKEETLPMIKKIESKVNTDTGGSLMMLSEKNALSKAFALSLALLLTLGLISLAHRNLLSHSG